MANLINPFDLITLSIRSFSLLIIKMGESHKFYRATLYYKGADDNEWLEMEGLPTLNKGNVANVIFDDNIRFEQRLPQGVVICSLTLLPGKHYRSLKLSGGEEQEGRTVDYLLEFEVNHGHLPPCALIIKAGYSEHHSLDEFPLHRMFNHFCFLKLRLPYQYSKPVLHPHEITEKLIRLTSCESAAEGDAPN